MLNLMDAQQKMLMAKGQLHFLQKQLQETDNKVLALQKQQDSAEKALAFLQDVAQKTQVQLQQSLQSAVQSCIDLLFPGYDFHVSFEARRNKIEADLFLTKGSQVLRPMDDNGGGVVDAVSFALRVGCLRLANNSPVLLLDEPFKYVRGQPREDLGHMLELLVSSLGIQVIMVGDVAGTQIAADKVYDFK